MPHDHLSPSGHPYRPDQDSDLTYWQAMEIAIRELLIEKKVTTAAEITAPDSLRGQFHQQLQQVMRQYEAI